jgi:predicted enzyme related to lactoylglutathione lyase
VASIAHGAPTWFEARTNDADRASKFYAELFAWKPEVQEIPNAMRYTIFKYGSAGPTEMAQVGVMMQIGPETGDMPPHWATFFHVNHVDETSRSAAEHGGKVLMPPHDIPTVGRFAALESPQGVKFLVIKFNMRGAV